MSEAASEIGVSADEGELMGGGGAHRGAKLRVKVRRVAKRAARPRLVGHPRRMLKEMTERSGEGRTVKGVELVEGGHRKAARTAERGRAFKRVIRKQEA